MKKEINFYHEKRHGKRGEDLLKIYRLLGYTDDEIKEELEKIKRGKKKNGSRNRDKK